MYPISYNYLRGEFFYSNHKVKEKFIWIYPLLLFNLKLNPTKTFFNWINHQTIWATYGKRNFKKKNYEFGIMCPSAIKKEVKVLRASSDFFSVLYQFQKKI